jgi:hypothetical protein
MGYLLSPNRIYERIIASPLVGYIKVLYICTQ